MSARQKGETPGYAVSRDEATEADSSMAESAARKLVQPADWGIRAQKANGNSFAVSRDEATVGDFDAPAFGGNAQPMAPAGFGFAPQGQKAGKSFAVSRDEATVGDFDAPAFGGSVQPMSSGSFGFAPQGQKGDKSFAVSRDEATMADDDRPAFGGNMQPMSSGSFGFAPRGQKAGKPIAVSRDAETMGAGDMPAIGRDEATMASDSSDSFGFAPGARKSNNSFVVSRDAETMGANDMPAVGRDADTMASDSYNPNSPDQWNFGGSGGGSVPGMISFATNQPKAGPSAAQASRSSAGAPAAAPAPAKAASAPSAPPGVQFFSGAGGSVPVQAPGGGNESGGMEQGFFSSDASVPVPPSAPTQDRPDPVPYATEEKPARGGRESRPAQMSYNSYAAEEKDNDHPVDREKHYIDYEQHSMIAEANYNQQLSAYHKHYEEWKRRVWILPAFIVTVLIVSVLIGAFLSPAFILLFVLLVVLAVVVLAVTGKLNWLKLMKKPKKTDFQMEAPELEAIHSVRIRLSSINLSTPVEITIRNKMQIIGSSETECREPLKFRGISRRHISITCENRSGNSEYFVTDLKSSNGTKLNGAKLKPYEPYPIKFGDIITLAGLYEFRVSSDAQ